MNRKGSLVLRDVIFMIILFAGIMALGVTYATTMADTYENTNMTTELTGDDSANLGDDLLANMNDSIADMRGATEGEGGLIGSFKFLSGALDGASTIIKAAFKAPIYVGNAIEVVMNTVGVPQTLAAVISNIIIMLIYALIIFVLISAALRGGKV